LFESDRSLRRPKLNLHKVLRNSIFGGRLFQKRLRRNVVFQVGVQKVQSIECDLGITRVGVLTPVVSHLILRKALRILPALEHRTELWVSHAEHIRGVKITMYPIVEDVWTIFVRGRNSVDVQILKAHISRKANERNSHSFGMNVPGFFHEAGVTCCRPALCQCQRSVTRTDRRCRLARNRPVRSFASATRPGRAALESTPQKNLRLRNSRE